MPPSLNLTKHHISFKHAFEGLRHTVITQPNLRIHSFIALIVLLAAALFQVNRLEWLILLFTIMWVLTAEMVNTSIESIVNLITHEYRQEAKVAKDVGAGMVLVAALGAVIVGLIIFVPYIKSWLSPGY